jgi:hypothetical protein
VTYASKTSNNWDTRSNTRHNSNEPIIDLGDSVDALGGMHLNFPETSKTQVKQEGREDHISRVESRGIYKREVDRHS